MMYIILITILICFFAWKTYIKNSSRSRCRTKRCSLPRASLRQTLAKSIITQQIIEIVDEKSHDDIPLTAEQDIKRHEGFETEVPTGELVAETELSSCSICLRDFELGEEIGWSHNPDCVHGFHKRCIIEWLIMKNECPICRRQYVLQRNSEAEKTKVIAQ